VPGVSAFYRFIFDYRVRTGNRTKKAASATAGGSHTFAMR
jgi:hypothetical protein